MPYKSEAQRRYFHAAASSGDISKKTVKEFDKASKGKSLPEKILKKAFGGYIDSVDEQRDYSHHDGRMDDSDSAGVSSSMGHRKKMVESFRKALRRK